MKRLVSIDALRGIAALGVLYYHAAGPTTFLKPGFPLWLRMLSFPCSFGFAGVWLFFVISGFCIHMRHARRAAAGEEPEIAFWSFWRRRFRRLYPAYFAALILASAVWVMTGSRITAWDGISHLLLVHNLTSSTVFSINGAFWTLAVEEQLYLLYFALLAVRRRLNWVATLIFCLGLRAGVVLAAITTRKLLGWSIVPENAALSYWFLWVLGAVAVEGWVGLIRLPRLCYDLRLGAACFVLAALLNWAWRLDWVTGGTWLLFWFVQDPLFGLAAFVLLNWMVARELETTSSHPWTALARIGLFSYSLYLIHGPLMVRIRDHIPHLSPTLSVPLCLFLWAPVCVAAAAGFFQLFERPFLSSRVPVASAPSAAPRPPPPSARR